MVIYIWQKLLEGSLCDTRGRRRVHASAVGTASTATHKPPIIHAIKVQQAVLDALGHKHARHDGALSYRSMPICIAKIKDDY